MTSLPNSPESERTAAESVSFCCSVCRAEGKLHAGPNVLSRFCPHCGARLQGHQNCVDSSTVTPAVDLVSGYKPTPEEIKFTLGPYYILDSIGKGGMGEVFVAYDTLCGRRIAVKKIREDLLEHVQLQDRFLKEAHITSQLTHPAIIPIHTIHQEENLIYYTMPFVKGDTLKEILRQTRREEKKKRHQSSIGSSIPALIRIFLTICHAIAYAHSKNILHRDLKPENIIVGQYGEVLILDWGLAKRVHDTEDDGESELADTPFHGLTRLGKVVGTVAYMAPERAFGQPATFQTDIYSLGVILYQLLTLQPPFRRGTLSEFRQTLRDEVLEDPSKIAPYRDVPRPLARISQKCLEVDPQARYQTLEELIHDLENFTEGRSEWFPLAELDIQRKEDWEFRENVLINEHIAITRGNDLSEWVSLMVSKSSFNGNTMLIAKVRCGPNNQGIGLMLCIPESAERVHVNDGYCLWLGTDLAPTTKLLRSTVEVISRPDITLQRGQWYVVTIEKVDNNVHVYINDVLQFSYISHLPLMGTHVGLLTRDADFDMHPLSIYVSSLNLTVNCLAVPDAFLAHKEYTAALSEYRRIAYSFPGRAEGREALFKAGVTLLEQARNCSDVARAEQLYEAALSEFSKQRDTPGAPLEYIGKGLVYQALRDYGEEIKCYELAFRRYPNHPLLPMIYEQVIYRMHESSKHHRKATYKFVLLSLCFLPKHALGNNVRKLFSSLQKHWEPLDFIRNDPVNDQPQYLADYHFAIQLAFWLAKPYVIAEIVDKLLHEGAPSAIALTNAMYSLLELGSLNLAKEKYRDIVETLAETATFEENRAIYTLAGDAITWHSLSLEQAAARFCDRASDFFGVEEERLLHHLMRRALRVRAANVILAIADQLRPLDLDYTLSLRLDHYRIWALLLANRWHDAGALLHSYPLELLSQENSLFHFLYGCWLLVTEGSEIADVHFAGLIEVPYPRSWMLMAYDLNGKIGLNPSWYHKAFMWEKRQLFQQLSLFYHCSGDAAMASHYQDLELQEYVHDTP